MCAITLRFRLQYGDFFERGVLRVLRRVQAVFYFPAGCRSFKDEIDFYIFACLYRIQNVLGQLEFFPLREVGRQRRAIFGLKAS